MFVKADAAGFADHPICQGSGEENLRAAHAIALGYALGSSASPSPHRLVDWPSFSEVESVAHFTINLARFEIVSAAEGKTVIQQEAPVSHINALDRNRPTLPKVLSHRQVEGGMLRQTGGSAVVGEPRSIVVISANPRAPRQVHVSTGTQRMLLVVIQQEKIRRWSEQGEPAGSYPPSLSTLTGIRQMHPATAQQQGRAECYFPSVYPCSLNC